MKPLIKPILAAALWLAWAPSPAQAAGITYCKEPEGLPELYFPGRWRMLSPAVPWERPWRYYETDSEVWDAIAAYFEEAGRPPFEAPKTHPESFPAVPADAGPEEVLSALWNDPDPAPDRLLRRHRKEKEKLVRDAERHFGELWDVHFSLRFAYMDVQFVCQRWSNRPTRETAEAVLGSTLTFEALVAEKLDERTLQGLRRVNPHLARALLERQRLVGTWSEAAARAAYGLLRRPLKDPE